MDSIQQQITQAADGSDITVRSYSGRYMYGKECLAIVGDMSQMRTLIANVIKEAHTTVFEAAIEADTDAFKDKADAESNAMVDLIDEIMNFQTDSMGLSTVLYWPGIEWIEPEMTFAEWQEGIAEMMNCTVASLVKKCEGKFNLRTAYDQQQTIEDAAEDIDCSCNN